MADFDSREEARRLRWEARKKKWEAKMERHAYRDQAPGHSHIWTGLFLLLIGGVSLVKSFGAPLPPWVFSWQMLLIVIGLFIGFRRGFDHGGWMIPVLIGLAFMLNDYFLDGTLRHHMWPMILIVIGIIFIVRPRRNRWHYRWGVHNDPWDQKKSTDMNTEDRTGENAENFSHDDVVDATSIFGGTKKVILSKNFKGGDIVNIFGGSEIDLTKADMKDTAVLEVTALFGGATLLVPSNWAVKSEAVTIFGGISDKRSITGFSENTGKNLLLRGTVIFGGIEIKSY